MLTIIHLYNPFYYTLNVLLHCLLTLNLLFPCSVPRIIRKIPPFNGKLTREVGHVCTLIHYTLHEAYGLSV